MIKTTTFKTITFSAALALSASFGTAALAHDDTEHASAGQKQINITKKNARNLVRELLKRDYSGNGYHAHIPRKTGNKWVVRIKKGMRPVATAYVDEKTGNIHVKD